MRRLLLLVPLLLLLGAGIAAALAWRGVHAPGPLAEPATVVIPAGQASATFAVNAVDDAVVDGTQAVTVTATASAPGGGYGGPLTRE